MGSFLNLTCESGYSRPPARLQLLINNHAVNVKQANLIQVVHEYTGPDEPIPAVNTSTSGSPDRPIHSFRLADHSPASSSLTERHFWRPSLYRSSLHMLFYLDSNDFGVSTWIEQRPTVLLRVKCVAFVSHLHTQNALRTLTVFPTELMTSTISPDLIAQHQPEESASNHSEPTLHTDRLPKVGGPFIFGAQRSYLPGQTVNVTCASRKSRFGSDLRWYINDHEAPYRFVRNYRRIELDDGIVTLIDLFFTLPESSAMSTVTPAIAVATSNASTSAGNHLTFQQSLLASPLRLRCTAILSRVVNMRSKELLLDADQSIFNSQNDSISSRSENISLNVFVLVTIFISHLIRRRQSA